MHTESSEPSSQKTVKDEESENEDADNAPPTEGYSKLPSSNISVLDQNETWLATLLLSVKFNSKTAEISMTPSFLTVASNV